jgi:aryl-alcohol dehydrogenase-like predicted oxidoreductase
MENIMTRTLGRSNIEVSALGLGCWAIGGPAWREETPVGWGEVSDEESVQAIHRALELGVTFFDTADVYGAGHSERVLARALGSRRKQVVIATKFGNTFDEATRQIGGGGSVTSPEGIRQSCERSLERLNTDYIDLYQFHIGGWPLEDALEVRETLDQLVREGKIRSFGWSTDDPLRARFFAESQHCTAVQNQMNVLEDNPGMVALCELMNLASINRGPLAMGLLTGKYTANSVLADNDVRGSRGPDWMRYFKNGVPNPEWSGKIEGIREILTSGGRTLAQGALAWLWGRTDKTIPIPGFRTVQQVEDNAGAMRHGPLTPEQMLEIEGLMDRA